MTRTDNSDELRRALIDTLLLQWTTIGFANVVAVTVVATAWWIQLQTSLVFVWMAAAYGVTVVRVLLIRHARREPDVRQRYRKFYRVMLGITLSNGLVVGVGAVAFMTSPSEPATYTAVIMILGMATAGVAAMSAVPSVYATVVIPSLGLSAYGLFSIGANLVGIVCVMAIPMLLAFAYNLHKHVVRTLLVDAENLRLVQRATQAREEAERSNRAKSQFLAAASHDLRQPLHAMGLYLDSLQREVSGERAGVLLTQIGRAHHALEELFAALLEISRLDSGSVQPEMQHFGVGELLRSVCDEYRELAEGKGLQLYCSNANPTAYADPVLVSRIVRNLLSNAVKYTEQGEVCLEVSEVDGVIRVLVRDTGIGIAADEQLSIFDEYRQINNPQRDRSKGMGLGLAVVRRLSELMALQIDVESAVGAGSSFAFNLPKGDVDQVATADVDAQLPTPLQGRRILVVDNERPILEAMRLLLTGWGCVPMCAESLRQALRLIEQEGHWPDAMLIDYRLDDGVNGIEVMDDLRRRLGREIPAALITGDTSPELLEHFGAHELYVLHKPVRPMQLNHVLTQLLGESLSMRGCDIDEA